MKLLLFDIDGVIAKVHDKNGLSAHKKAFINGIKEVYGVEYKPKIKNHQGMTDKQIIVEELKLHGLDEEKINKKINRCMKAMDKIFQKEDKSGIEIIEGIKELFEKLNQNKKVIIALLTGNVEGIAYEKMRILGLRDYFKVGGFGSDPHEKRSDLVKVAKEKAEKLGYKIDEIYIIGDTPRDIEAGKEANVKTIIVATGRFSIDELKEHNPDYLYKRLEAAQVMKDIGV